MTGGRQWRESETQKWPQHNDPKDHINGLASVDFTTKFRSLGQSKANTMPSEGPIKQLPPMIQVPSGTGSDRLPVPMPFNASDLLMRYPLGMPPPSNQWASTDLKLHLPPSLASDPRLWSREDVAYFLRWCETEFDLPNFDMELFQMNGKALCFLTKSDLHERSPAGTGTLLHNILQLLIRETNAVPPPVTPPPAPPASSRSVAAAAAAAAAARYSTAAFPYGSWYFSELYAQQHAMMHAAAVSPANSLSDGAGASPERGGDHQGSSGFGSGNSTGGSHNSDSEEEPPTNSPFTGSADSGPVPGAPPTPNSPPSTPNPSTTIPNGTNGQWTSSENARNGSTGGGQIFFGEVGVESNTNGRLLWDFLQQLLNDPAQRYKSFIAWKNHETGVFKIVDPAGLAKLWGIQKNHLSMNYDKMSRALRYYYRVNILRKVQGERHCYQFLRNPSELKSIKNISLLRQQISMQQQQQQSPQPQAHSFSLTPVKPDPDGNNEPTDLSTPRTPEPIKLTLVKSE